MLYTIVGLLYIKALKIEKYVIVGVAKVLTVTIVIGSIFKYLAN